MKSPRIRAVHRTNANGKYEKNDGAVYVSRKQLSFFRSLDRALFPDDPMNFRVRK